MGDIVSLTNTWVGYICLFIFFVSYYFISREERYHLNKAKPALLAGTSMFILIGIYFVLNGLDTNILRAETEKLIVDISEIFFFLLVAMTYIEVMVNRGVFEVLKRRLIHHGFNYRQLFWILGLLAFFISAFANNLATALILSTVAVSLTKDPKILVPIAINIVVGSNAGGVWSPFGDITTLMVWSEGKVEFSEFLYIFPSAFLGWLFTSFILSLFVPKTSPESKGQILNIKLKSGAKKVIYLGLFTIFISVVIDNYFNIPAMWGMMFGLALLHLVHYHSKKFHREVGFDIYKNMKKTELDTLLFFFGILSAIGALDFLGYLHYIVTFYDYVGINTGNILTGLFSGVVDNIPVTSAVLKSDLNMNLNQWLIFTMTVGIGGSLISFGSAAGVGVMSKMKGIYTFSSHIKFFPIILLGYFFSIFIFFMQNYIISIIK